MDLLENNVGLLIHDVARLLRKRFEQNARGLGLTRAQAQVLVHIARSEGMQQGDLADLLEVEPITLTRILDRLEAAGHVERRAHPTDRRVRQLYLTPSAHPLIAQIVVIGAKTRTEAFEGVPAKDRAILFEVLTAMKGNLLGIASGAILEESKNA